MLNTKQRNTVSKTQRASYEKLENSTESLAESLYTFLIEGEESVFEQAGEDKTQVYDAVKKMLNDYNDTVKALKNTSNPLNDFYREMMHETVKESEEGLVSIGVTQNENGTLSLDKEKLETVDVETIKKALDGNGLFSTKLAFITSRICDNAKANMESFSSQYGADGYGYTMNTSRYDFWG